MSDTPIIAVIDADESFRFALAKFVKSSGFEVEVFASAEEFNIYRRIGDTACLIIDANMPGMSGLELQSHMASADRHNPITFITASPDEGHALAAEAIDFFRKPSGKKSLLKEIRSTLRVKAEWETKMSTPATNPEGGTSETPVVSVIDDDESVCRAMERLIRSFGFAVATFSSAREFLLSTHVFDTACLILDQQMPHLNGLQLQRHLAQAGCRIPIIFITAYPDESARTRTVQAGAVDFLEKPFRDDVLLDGIRRALRVSTVDRLR